jgi:cell wall-associated NlpC family hydrolase
MSLSRVLPCAAALLFLAGCVTRAPETPHYPRPRRAPRAPSPRPLPRATEPAALPRIQYSIQVGAFSDSDNAVRLIEELSDRGVEAFYFVGSDGLHRVRFGSFDTKEVAAALAEEFKVNGIIGSYYVLPPEPVAVARDDSGLRDQLVRTALGFLGRPYHWGGPSPETGFDCSGLTMAVYRLHGLALPRTAAEQYAAGGTVSADRLQKADLVFFDTGGHSRPSHVGLYLGDGRFVHAPSSGGVVRIDELAQDYYHRRFLSARSYLTR